MFDTCASGPSKAPSLTHSSHSRRVGCLTWLMAFRCEQLSSAMFLLYSASTWCTNDTAIEPSPTADATRLIFPPRISPTANTPGRLVSRRYGGRLSGHLSFAKSSVVRSNPVLITTSLSKTQQQPRQAEFGTAPVIEKRCAMLCDSVFSV